ncbi:hypothetical protein [Kitasatospora purpeofusca]|uniref:hypothetical protein n=1 Tax=Kitasatospora purpeofusca TaxID=67352 RepID=UPI002A5AC2AE|nr:hypothetical protein [Kitasatospora purpeofusca]MDY0812215.1 hypothetical protein [Kitasatospora purpeofusca]
MYEMWAETDPAVDPAGLMWHVVSKDDASTALCGQLLELSRRVVPNGLGTSVGTPDRYCDPCLVTVRETMASADH